MKLSVNRKVWQYMLIVLALMLICISFLFYIKPIFIAVVLGILVTISIDKTIGLFKKFTKGWSPLKRGTVAAVYVIVILLLGSIFVVGAAINIKNNFEDFLDIFDDFNSRYDELADELYDDFTDNSNDRSANTTDSSADIPPNTTRNQTENNAVPPPNNTSGDFFRNTRSDVIRMSISSDSSLMASTKDILSLITSTIFASALVIPLTAFYYFKEKGRIKQRLVSLVPDKYKSMFEKAIQDVTSDIGTYTTVKILEAIIISFLYCISFYVIGLPHWFLFGVLMGVFNIVSYLGFVLPTASVLVYAYSVGMEVMYAAACVILVVQLFDFFFILPNLIMKTIRISPLTAVLLTLAGLKLFGFFGLVFALPIYIFCKIFLIACYKLLTTMYPDNDWQEVHDD